MPTKENDPAFTGPTKDGFTSGCTKLELFTALAMAGFIASADVDQDKIAIDSLKIAKRIIVELNKPVKDESRFGFTKENGNARQS